MKRQLLDGYVREHFPEDPWVDDCPGETVLAQAAGFLDHSDLERPNGLVRRSQPEYRPPFELDDFMIVERRRHIKNGADHNEMMGEAVVKVARQLISNEAETGTDQWNVQLGWLF